MNIAGFDACIGRGVAAIRARVLRPWINHFVSSKRDDIHALGTGATFPNVSGTMLSDLVLLVPPIPEQQRIVRILDEAFDGIATAKANAEKSLQNARALFESHLQAVFTQRGEGWVEKRLGEVAESISTGPFGTMLHKSDYVPHGIPLVNPMNIVDSRIVPSSQMMVSEETRKRLRVYALKAGDVVIGRREFGEMRPRHRQRSGMALRHWFVFSATLELHGRKVLCGPLQFRAVQGAAAEQRRWNHDE